MGKRTEFMKRRQNVPSYELLRSFTGKAKLLGTKCSALLESTRTQKYQLKAIYLYIIVEIIWQSGNPQQENHLAKTYEV